MAIADEKYVALTTYRKDGTPKSLPVWIADLGDGTVGFTTGSDSWKVKRLANDPRVVLQPSDSRGTVKPGSQEVTGTGVAVTGAEFERVKSLIKSKYGMSYHVIGLMTRIATLFGRGGTSDGAIVITLD